MYLVGIEIGNFDYDFCERIDLSFIEKYEPDFKKYKKSLKNYKDKDDEDYINLKYLDLNDYDDINCGENDVIYYKLNHFIDTYFDTDLCFYTEPISCKLYDNEPLYLGVFTDDNSVKNINKIKKNYDMDTFKTILELLNIDECKLKVYELDD